jgi:hypothetical protein
MPIIEVTTHITTSSSTTSYKFYRKNIILLKSIYPHRDRFHIPINHNHESRTTNIKCRLSTEARTRSKGNRNSPSFHMFEPYASVAGSRVSLISYHKNCKSPFSSTQKKKDAGSGSVTTRIHHSNDRLDFSTSSLTNQLQLFLQTYANAMRPFF